MHVLLDGVQTGAENMRRDDILLGLARPTLRLYGWSPETVSLGSNQSERDIDLDAIRELGLDTVKRGTGGGGILHNATEVTYAVVLPIDFPGLPRDLPASFAYLSQGIVTALRSLGVPAELEVVGDLTRESLCYVRKQGTNVVVAGKKISGGAQRRTRHAVLQHGTIIVDRDEHRLARVFRTPIDTVCDRVTSLHLEGHSPTRAAITDAVIAGFTDVFGPLTPLAWSDVPQPPPP
jgi:lipoate-protein ligase A